MNKNTTTSTENLYHLNGKISVKQAIPFGLQHILAMFVANIAPIFIVAAASGLSTADLFNPECHADCRYRYFNTAFPDF